MRMHKVFFYWQKSKGQTFIFCAIFHIKINLLFYFRTIFFRLMLHPQPLAVDGKNPPTANSRQHLETTAILVQQQLVGEEGGPRHSSVVCVRCPLIKTGCWNDILERIQKNGRLGTVFNILLHNRLLCYIICY